MEIEFIDVNYSINNKQILKNINLKFNKNSINSIIGASGSGKTTLVKMINGALLPDSGEIKIDGKKINNEKTIGIVHQNSEEQIDNSTVKEEIESYLEYYNYTKGDRQKHIKDALKMVCLDNTYLNKNPLNLSTGEMKLVSLASVLAFNPKIIVLDEPTVGLDSKEINNVIKIIRLLKNRFHKTIILVSKDMDFVHKLSDNIFILSGGKIVKSGNKYDIFTDKNLLNKYNIEVPKVIKFSNLVYDRKKIKLGYRDEINDLLKDIYRLSR